MERNQVTGIILITLLMLGYFMYVGNKPPESETSNKDTVTALSTKHQTIAPKAIASIGSDSSITEENKSKFGALSIGAVGEDKEVVLENENIKVFLSSRGGLVKKVLLKKYFTSEHSPLYLFNEQNNSMSLSAIVAGRPVDLYSLYYTPTVETLKDSTVVKFDLKIAENQYIQHTYAIGKSGYTISYNASIVGLNDVVEDKPLVLDWVQNLPHTENDDLQSRDRSTINYYTVEEEFNNLTEASKSTEEEVLSQPLKWISLKQKYFNTGFIASNTITNAIITATPTLDTSGVKLLKAKLTLPVADFKSGKGNFKFYFGPTKSKDLKNVADGYYKNLYLGYPVIREFNRYVVMPLFDFLQKFITNYGLIIIILGILVKILLLPLSFKSQVSMAKMRVMKPELDELKELYPDDLQKQQSEQMKLYQKVGINPLSGCVPVLLSMPVLLAMFSFFPNAIELRQQGFLWASDLSTYDAPFHLPFTIPFYGSHVSIFTLLMTLSTLALTFFNNQMTTTQGPMKSVSYIMPVVFMFVLNSFPAGLSFYYLVSNILSIAQQKLMQQFVDEDKIKNQLEENRKKHATGQTGTKSKWMQRVEEAMKSRDEQVKNQKKNK